MELKGKVDDVKGTGCNYSSIRKTRLLGLARNNSFKTRSNYKYISVEVREEKKLVAAERNPYSSFLSLPLEP